MTPNYHAKSLAIVGHEARFSKTSKTALDLLERKHQGEIRIPLAVREWYEMADAVELLGRYSNDDRALPIHQLRPQRWRQAGDPSTPLEVLEFLVENQGVCMWATTLSGADDPPVVVRWNESDDLRGRPCADSFSAFVYTRIWDFQPWVEGWTRLDAQDEALDERSLAWLRGQYREGPTTQTAGCFSGTTYRFESSRGRLLIGNYGIEGRTEMESNWKVASRAPEDLRALAQELEQSPSPPRLYRR